MANWYAGCREGTSYCYIVPRLIYSGANSARLTKFDTGAIGYDGEFTTKTGLSEETLFLVVNQPNFLISSSRFGRYAFIDPTFPNPSIIVSSGQLTTSGTTMSTVASDDPTLGVLVCT